MSVPNVTVHDYSEEKYGNHEDQDTIDDDGEGSVLEKERLLESEQVPDTWIRLSSMLINRLRRSSLSSLTLSSLQSIAIFLIPSFINSRWSRRSTKPETTNNIAALDGLRGLACLFVFNEHLTYNYTRTFLFGYGVGELRTFVQWPFVRVLWSGFSMVTIFYVISGYVLSYKPLKQIRSKDMLSFQKTITSSVLRRALRLYLPTTIAVLICGFGVYIGVFSRAREVFFEKDNYLQLHEPPPPVAVGFFAQMDDAMRSALRMMVFWNWTDSLSAGDYDMHLWTIVVEFQSSMILFLIIVGVSRLRQFTRLMSVLLFIVYCVMTGRKEVILFVSGMFIAELDMMRKTPAESKSILPSPNQQDHQKRNVSSIAWPLIFIVGLYFTSVPTIGADTTPGFQTLISWVPSTYGDNTAFLRAIGAVLTTWSVANSEAIKPIFTNPFSAYLGKISYALYLVHGNVLKSVGYSVTPSIYYLTSSDGTPAGLTTGGMVLTWLLATAIIIPFTFCVADIFWRAIDTPCVKFARWVENKLSDDFEN